MHFQSISIGKNSYSFGSAVIQTDLTPTITVVIILGKLLAC